MSTLIFFITVGILVAGYFLYGRYVRSILGIDPTRKTPAQENYDGVDYVPAKNWMILFGHHFASIAGAGPIVGPVFAYLYWGWFGVIVWIVFGCIFMGAVHDFSSLFISLREGGVTIGQVAQKYISRRASIVFLIFLWFSLSIVIAVFADICAKSFINEPKVVLPSLGLIPVAMGVGFLIYRMRFNTVLATLVGLLCLAALIFLGNWYPLSLPFTNPYLAWLIILFTYSFIASIMPVDILLQPRDYISSFLLFFGISVAFMGIIAKPQALPSGHFFTFSSSIGPFFPIMFITVACGAVSGFHALVSSGTTSKQLASERDAQKVGYGAMILEGILAVIALMCVVFGVGDVPAELKNPIEIFSLGFGRIVFFLGDYAGFVALVILNAFILTTLDTATRINRFLTQELFRTKNKYGATVIVVVFAAYLCFSGTFEALWPMFGASNQLVAGLALLVVTAYLLRKKRNHKLTLVPAIVMFIITFAALVIEAVDFFKKSNYLLCIISVFLMVLGVFIIGEFIRKRKSYGS